MKNKIIIIGVTILVVILAVLLGIVIYSSNKPKTEEEILKEYISSLNKAKYEEMYEMLTEESKQKIEKDAYVEKNKNIYSGIDMKNATIEIKNKEEVNNKETKVTYQIGMETQAGNVSFENTTNIVKEDKKYKIDWNTNFIFPKLEETDKVRVKKTEAKRGNIIDRNGNLLAGEAEVSSVGFVPQKMNQGEARTADLQKVAELLDTTVESIEKELSASWVKEDSFVPIKKVAKSDTQVKEQLLQVPGIKISTVKDRYYPLAEKAAHITGYIQNITAEELEKNEGYTQNSKIGKVGLEKQFEERLKGQNGVEIYIEDEAGNKKQTLAQKEVQNGEDIKLTIDSELQEKLYNELKDDEGFFVVMQPNTGELLALVSTPSYNPNDFIFGIGTNKWNAIKADERKPMYTRYLQSWCPGSTFKAITGAVALTTGAIQESDEVSYNGLSWKKDESWGDYAITTLTAYSGAKNLRNAIIHSDNIFFGQTALKIGSKNFTEALKKIKFNESLGIELDTAKSQYSNNEKIESETLLADSGYGQGQILVNPIHMASIYSAFANDGNMIKPYIEYKENAQTEYLVENAFSKEAANIIKDDLIQVVENPEGTAKDMKIQGKTIAGKTGTAELKKSKEETGETLGWFDCFTVGETAEKSYLVISMVENASQNGGSHYLIPKIRKLL